MKNFFKHQAAVDHQDLARYLDAVSEGLKRGRFKITADGQNFTVNPSGLMDLNLELRRAGGRGRMVLALTWAEEKTAEDALWPPKAGESEDGPQP